MLQKRIIVVYLNLIQFGVKNMATNKKRITVSLTEDQYSTLEKLAKEKGFSKSAILALALEDYSRKELEQKK